MIEFLKTAALLMAVMSTLLMFVGFTPALRRSKVYNFLCGELFFVTAIAYGGLAVLGTTSFALFWLWFIAGSVKFAHATFLATE